MVRLTLSSLLIHKSVNRAIRRRSLDQSVHDEEQRFPQIRGILLGSAVAFPVVIARLVGSGGNASEGGQRFPVHEPCAIADLGYQLGTKGEPTPFISMMTGYTGSV